MDKRLLWEGILTRLSSVINRAHVLSFFKDSIVADLSNGVMTIAVPTIYAFDFMRNRYESKFLETAKELNPEVREIKIEIKGSLMDEDHPDKPRLATIFAEDKHARKLPGKAEVIISDGMRSKMLNPKYTLDSYIAGNQNRLAQAACMAVGNKPGDIYNPLFLYGDVGLGKTHLLQGIGLEIIKRFPNKNVVYMTSERFINEIIEAIGTKHTKSFKDKYRKVDCLIIDDVQFFGNKASSQQEFFHTFNELYDNKKQLVLSSDCPPAQLDGMEDRLKSRFAMGMVIEVQKPDYETRLAILNSKCMEHQVLIDKAVLEFIAYNVDSSVRELEGVLLQAVAESQLMQTTPTVRSVAQVIRKLGHVKELVGYEEQDARRLVVRSIDDIVDIVARYFKLPKSDIIGECRSKELMIPRQIAMYLIRELLDQSYETIGESFGGRNHTTVLHSCNKIEQHMAQDERIKRDINALKKEMGV